MPPPRRAKKAPPQVRDWVRPITAACRRARITVRVPSLTRLAALLTLIGAPDDPTACRVYYALRLLFMNKARISRWDSALDIIPAERSALVRIADCVSAYAVYADVNRLARARFRLDDVVRVMLQIPHPRAYIRAAARSKFLEPRALFHKNSLNVARKRQRGAQGPLHEMTDRHKEQLRKRVKVVED